MSAPESPKRPPPPPARPAWMARARMPFEPDLGRRVVRRSSIVLYTVVAILLAGTALYMGVIQKMPLTSAYVAAPAVGAAWFGLRIVMMLAPKN